MSYKDLFKSGNTQKSIYMSAINSIDLGTGAVGVLAPEHGGTGSDTLSTLTINRNNVEVGTFQINNDATINIEVPVITHGTTMPTGGNNGDIYLLHK